VACPGHLNCYKANTHRDQHMAGEAIHQYILVTRSHGMVKVNVKALFLTLTWLVMQ
jgi:predicted metal-binding protein